MKREREGECDAHTNACAKERRREQQQQQKLRPINHFDLFLSFFLV